jgi:hypothetical protein
LAEENALLDYLAVTPGAERLVALAHLRRQLKVPDEVAHHQHGKRVHVVGERGGGVAARDLLGDQTIGLEVCPETAILLGDTKGEEAGGV